MFFILSLIELQSFFYDTSKCRSVLLIIVACQGQVVRKKCNNQQQILIFRLKTTSSLLKR